MKRYLKYVALLGAMALILAACGSDPETSPTTTSPAPTTTAGPKIGEGRLIGMAFDIGGRGDLSFNDLAAGAYDSTKALYGFTGQELAPDSDGSDREQNLQLLAETDHELIIANGFAFAQNVWRVGTAFPDVMFAITDDCPQDDTFSVVEMDNVRCMLFSEEEGSFLMGVAAALTSESGTVGFIGGVEVPLILKFQAGFEAGARAADPDITILDAVYLTQVPDFTGFNDPVRGREAALALYEDGADVIFQAAGGSSLGVFRAAKEYSESSGDHVWAIGVDKDQYNSVLGEAQVEGEGALLQPHILTSMLKGVDVAVAKAITDFLNDTFTPGATRLGLKEGGVGYYTSGGFIDDIVDELENYKAQIVSGAIVVPTTP